MSDPGPNNSVAYRGRSTTQTSICETSSSGSVPVPHAVCPYALGAKVAATIKQATPGLRHPIVLPVRTVNPTTIDAREAGMPSTWP